MIPATVVPAPWSLFVIMQPCYFDMFASTIPIIRAIVIITVMTILPTTPAHSAFVQSIVRPLPGSDDEARGHRLEGYFSLLLAHDPHTRV
jgi:hypothetical protein